jgi:hypothetical protein
MLPYFLVAASILLALVAFARARRMGKRLDRLTESYWELRYELGQLNAKVARVGGTADEYGEATHQSAPKASPIIPLSSLKR